MAGEDTYGAQEYYNRAYRDRSEVIRDLDTRYGGQGTTAPSTERSGVAGRTRNWFADKLRHYTRRTYNAGQRNVQGGESYTNPYMRPGGMDNAQTIDDIMGGRR